MKSVIKDALSNVPFIGNSSGTIKQEDAKKRKEGGLRFEKVFFLCATHIKKLRFSILMVTTLKLLSVLAKNLAFSEAEITLAVPK